jgi:hypothetical protein
VESINVPNISIFQLFSDLLLKCNASFKLKGEQTVHQLAKDIASLDKFKSSKSTLPQSPLPKNIEEEDLDASLDQSQDYEDSSLIDTSLDLISVRPWALLVTHN